jgi:amino acid adenylation domain-containing protein
LSLVQQRLWFLDRLQPGNPAYHLAWAFELRGTLDRPALQTALDALAARHGSLRTAFRERDGEPEQVIGEASGWPLQVVTRSATSLPEIAAEAAAAPFRLATGPLARAMLIETAPDLHTLVLVVHHIVADGWSFGILSRELALCYAAARRGEPVNLPALTRDYADYAREQRRALAGGELARQLAYWQAQLKHAPPFIDLPTDRPRPALPSPRGARFAGTLPVELQMALRGLARAEGCTLFMVLLGAFDLLLARYAGTEDVVVGTPIAGRSQTELEGLVGFFVNTLVLRTDLRGNPTVRELLGRVRGVTLGAYEHAEVPFELLVETLQPPRSLSRTPFFQVLFNLHSEPGAPLALEGLDVRPVAVPRHTAKFELSVSLAETPAGLAVTIEYSTDLFLPASIERLVADYAVVLAGFVAAPEARLTELPFSRGRPDRVAPVVLATTAATTAGSLPAAFAEQVLRHPEALAVSAPATGHCAAVDWSYAQLDREASAIAGALAGQGVGLGERVGLWFGQGAGQVAGILGVLQAGGVYVPLDPLAPPARLEKIIRDAGLRIVVTDRSAPEWPVSGLTVVPREGLPAGEAASTWRAVDPDALAYLLYTSGSTGTPKGVPQSHGNVLHFIRAWAGNLGITPDDRLSLLSTYGYDAAVQDIFGALLTGASVCPLDLRRLDRETLLDRIADRGLTVLHGTPTAYRYLFGGRVACRQDLSRVRLVVLGGEAARRADFELFRARFRKGARFVNGYGLTEATAVTQWLADHAMHPYGQQLPIGRPIGGLKAQLVDEAGAPAAIVGEVVLEGPQVMPGYWPLPAAGAPTGPTPLPGETRGLDSPGRGVGPVGAPANPRRFHTGDRARYLPDGHLVFVGRVDERLKIGGIRIEPGDIEAALRALPAVNEAVVLAGEDLTGEPVLTACYTQSAGESPPTVRLLRAHLVTLLPASLIPARFIPCESLPRLPNGKVDRRALAAAGETAGAASAATDAEIAAEAAPTGDEEHHVHATLQDIWQRLLKRDAVGLDEDFFLLGGHSLLATRLLARIRDRLGVELPLIRVFEAPTIRGLAMFLAPDGIRMQGPDDSHTSAPAA